MCVIPTKKKAPQSTDQGVCHESLVRWLSRIVSRIALAPLVYLRAGVGDRIIWSVLGLTYIYNVSWEDPRVDRRELQLSENDHVITLASAGWSCVHV